MCVDSLSVLLCVFNVLSPVLNNKKIPSYFDIDFNFMLTNVRPLSTGVLPLQGSGHDSRGAGHAGRGHNAGHSRALRHIPRAAHLRIPLPALETQVHQIGGWPLSRETQI